MKIVLTSGHPHSGYQFAHEALVSAGLVPAQPSRREAMSAAQLHETIFQAHDLDPAGLSVDAQIAPGKVWQEMAVDLFMGNLAHQNWGWADGRAVWLLDFWKAFDPQIRFVLVYSAPEFAIGQMLCDQCTTPEHIEQAIDFWIACNTEILRFYHRNPDRCLLVNASAMLHAPAPFINKTVDTFGLTLAAPTADCQIDRTGISVVASSLAKALIEDRDDAMALYRELESTADVNALDTSVLECEKRQAWQEYSDLLARTSATADEAQAHGENLSRLRQEYEKAQLDAERQQQLAQLTKTREEQTTASHQTEIGQLQTKADELSQENELLLLQLHQVQEELESSFLQHQDLQARMSETAVERQAELAQLTKTRDEQTQLAAERQQQVAQLTKTRDEQTKLTSERQAQLAQLTKAKDDQTQLAAERQQQVVQLTKTRDEQTKLAAERHAQLAQLTKVGEEQARLAGEHQTQQALVEAKRQLDEQTVKSNEATTSASHQTEITQLQTKAGELSQENELLLLQLHQVQEELEHYFLQYQELAGKGQQQADQISVHDSLWRNSQPAEVTFDLRHEIAGDNWYPPEVDGCWAGPGDVSSLKLPPLGDGQYELQLDVVDAMEPEILYDMEVSLNGTPLLISKDWETYPALVLARYSTADIAKRPEWKFQFKFPKLVSPSQHGLDDLRNLAIRLRTLKLRKL